MKIILVEDLSPFHEVLGVIIKKRGSSSEMISARDITEAERVIMDNLNADIIILDGNIIGGCTLSLLQKIRPLFSGRIIAFSSNPELQEKMLANGADTLMDKGRLLSLFEIINT